MFVCIDMRGIGLEKFCLGGGGQPKDDERLWGGEGGGSGLLSKPEMTSFLDGPQPQLMTIFKESLTF